MAERIQLKKMADWAWNAENFWTKIAQGDAQDCWQWLGSTGPHGALFGAKRLKEDGVYHAQMTQARRILWAEHYGEYLANRQNIWHSCGNMYCMNPLHLSADRKTIKPRELRKHIGRHPGSRVIDGRVVQPVKVRNALAEAAAQLTEGAN